MAITLHHLENSRSQRVLWMLEELGLDYDVIRYDRDPKTMLAPPALKKVHSLGKSPVIEADGEVIAETAVIAQFLVDRAEGRLGAPAGQGRRYDFWMHYAEGSLMPPLLLKLGMSKVPLMGRMAKRRVQPMIDVHLDFVESELRTRDWFAGDAISAADVMMSFPLDAAQSRGGLDDSRPATTAWLRRIHARPAYQAALKVGGPYAYA
ncbi:glutathione S-transferase [Mesobaculum littorinae]|uniref:glutathione transferase n=1 Tax=Mesobaculum littorinae TaxID=2486419 RepID=A0A438AMD2_9RHOB|nr:glutathione S-transferase [Mesobaculum littorinae]RVV99829.1 glutathione S-transferase [Mesobaculum littorinae]